MAMDFAPTAYLHLVARKMQITASAATALRCGSSNLEGRKWLLVDNTANVPIFVGSEYAANTTAVDGTPTTMTAYFLGKYGTKLASGDRIWLPVSDNITVYARTNSGVKDIRIQEVA